MDRPATQAARCSWDRGRSGRAGRGRPGASAGAESPAGRPGAQSQAGPAEQQPRTGLRLLSSSAFDSLGLASGALSSCRSHRLLGFAERVKAAGLAFATDTWGRSLGFSGPEPEKPLSSTSSLDGSRLKAGRAYRGGTVSLRVGRGASGRDEVPPGGRAACPRTSSLPVSGLRPCSPRGAD
ncbi:collagen alpha-2(I) chain-like [Ailuropoda melanoleuca]|uniref:collagen alpha-2(I) chain-like n=1 Tax=Ailuropoda melanoleuca TaxID=9646 RepID=UPI00059B3719|nr:collagen alpha-2(I) chain-like [Ailuropoda melanoleuca]